MPVPGLVPAIATAPNAKSNPIAKQTIIDLFITRSPFFLVLFIKDKMLNVGLALVRQLLIFPVLTITSLLKLFCSGRQSPERRTKPKL
jgi:hypothetical protein